MLVGTWFFGWASDRYGRRSIVIMSNLLCAAFGLISGIFQRLSFQICTFFPQISYKKKTHTKKQKKHIFYSAGIGLAPNFNVLLFARFFVGWGVGG